MKRGVALLFTLIVAGALLRASGGASSAVVDHARLKAVTSRAQGGGASLVIEATEPVGYVVTQPDPLTVTVDLRNVVAEGFRRAVAVKAPIAAVAIESVDSLGAPSSRVRISLLQPAPHQVRSVRNSIVVDFAKPLESASGAQGATASRQGAPGSQQMPDSAALSAPLVSGGVDPIAALGLARAPNAQGSAAALVGAVQQAAAPAQPAVQPPVQTTPEATVDPCLTTPATGFTGNPISLDFQGADLRAVLRTFAEISGLNMVVDPQVRGTVDVTLRDVPWDQALQIILRANRIGCSREGTILRVAPIATLTAEANELNARTRAQADATPLATLTRQLSYSKGDDIVALLKQGKVLSARGDAFVDVRTNTIIITDLEDRLASTTELINTLDRPQPQVEIEARIVQTNKTYARALGVQWGFNGNVSPALGNTTPLAFPNSGSLGGRLGTGTGITQGPPPIAVGGAAAAAGLGGTSTAVNLPAPGATSGVGLALGSINGAFNLDVALSALENSGNGRLLSAPKVSTLNNVAAEMTQGIQIPIQTQANQTVSVTFKDAALTLKVVPQITAANTVIMNIAVENSTPDFSRAVGTSLIPPINTQRANTTVLVNDGQTTVIGGIYTSTQTNTSDTTPGLNRLPLLGWLFKREAVNDGNTELLIFITPRIIKS